MTGRAVTLAAALNAVFGLDLADAAEACAWLADGGWAWLEAWLDRHRNDADDTANKTSTRSSQ